MKLFLIFALASCSTAKASEPVTPPRNFAVEDVASVDKTLDCKPQYTDVGEHHTYSCLVAAKQIVCVTNDTMAGAVCAPCVPQTKTADAPVAPPEHVDGKFTGAKPEAPKKK